MNLYKENTEWVNMQTSIKSDQIPCINCITLAICKNYMITDPDGYRSNQDNDLFLTRHTVRRCQIATDYVYCIPWKIGTLEGPRTIMIYDENRIKKIRDYLLTPI